MLRSDFSFHLPDDLIAQRPSTTRGGSRLMTVALDGPPEISPFADIVDRFRGDEILVVNDTRVVPARVFGQKPTGGAVEVFVVEPIHAPGEPLRIAAMIRGKRLREGGIIELPLDAEATIGQRRGDGLVELALDGVPDLWAWLDAIGRVPLPPYIRRDPDADDRDRYQTVFARDPGAVAAPTAGLHFTPGLLDTLRAKGVEVHTVTLHVGPGTFLPVRSDDVREHAMHSERFEVPEATAKAVRGVRPVIAVGTTVVRALEAHARDPRSDRTDLFILPGFDFRLVDGLLTNFHLPESTLLMLVAGFAGRDRVLAAYRAAVEARMRFYSYGDAMLLRREDGRWT